MEELVQDTSCLGDKKTEDKLLGMLTTLLWEKLPAQERMRKLEEEYGIPMEREVVEEVGSFFRNRMQTFWVIG